MTQLIQTAEEYSDFAEKFYQLVKSELERIKTYNPEDLAHHMPVLISLVNSIGYLRGQDGAFPNRPRTPEKQKALYKFEDQCEEELQKFIDRLMTSSVQQAYKDRLTEYFIKARTFTQAKV